MTFESFKEACFKAALEKAVKPLKFFSVKMSPFRLMC